MKFIYLISIYLSFGILLLFSGCKNPPVGPGRTIVTSFYPVYIATLNITSGVNGVTLRNLTQAATGCLHDYQLTPQDMTALEGADIFVINGVGMEAFLDKVILDRPRLTIINASTGIDLIGTGQLNDLTAPLADQDKFEYNPHVWVSVTNAISQVRNIASALAKWDTANGIAYRKNADAYIARLDTLQIKMHTALDSLKNKKIITFHEAFPYFAKEFGLDIVAVVEREPGSEPSAGELARTVARIREAGVTAIFAEPQYPANAAKTIADESGINVFLLDPVVTGPDSLDAYISIMYRNLEVLRSALK